MQTCTACFDHESCLSYGPPSTAGSLPHSWAPRLTSTGCQSHIPMTPAPLQGWLRTHHEPPPPLRSPRNRGPSHERTPLAGCAESPGQPGQALTSSPPQSRLPESLSQPLPTPQGPPRTCICSFCPLPPHASSNTSSACVCSKASAASQARRPPTGSESSAGCCQRSCSLAAPCSHSGSQRPCSCHSSCIGIRPVWAASTGADLSPTEAVSAVHVQQGSFAGCSNVDQAHPSSIALIVLLWLRHT